MPTWVTQEVKLLGTLFSELSEKGGSGTGTGAREVNFVVEQVLFERT